MNVDSVRQQIKEILEIEDNDKCVDCGAMHPLWACVLNGVFVCNDCSILHREMDNSLSLVKAISLADFRDKDIKLLKYGGNKRFLKNLNEFGLIDIYNPYSLKAEKIKEKYAFIASSYYREILFCESDQGERPSMPAYEDGRARIKINHHEPGSEVCNNDNVQTTEKEENKLIGRIKYVANSSLTKSKSVIQSTSEKLANSQIAQSIKSKGSDAVNKIGGAGDYLSDKASSLAVNI